MTQQEINDYNRRCAEFLGWKYNEERDRWNEDMIHDYSFVNSIDIKFHSDWNWIMEVVEAIEEIGSYIVMGRKMRGDFEISSYGIKFYFNPNQKNLLHLELKPYLPDQVWKHPMYKHHIIQKFDFKNKTKKEAVVQAINQFLIWYNENITKKD